MHTKDCKMLISDDLFEQFQEIAFSLGYNWVNQSKDEKRIVSKGETGIGVILKDKKIYGAYSIHGLSSWSRSSVDIVQMHQFVRYYSEQKLKPTTLKLPMYELLKAISKLQDKNGDIELPLDIVNHFNLTDGVK